MLAIFLATAKQELSLGELLRFVYTGSFCMASRMFYDHIFLYIHSVLLTGVSNRIKNQYNLKTEVVKTKTNITRK